MGAPMWMRPFFRKGRSMRTYSKKWMIVLCITAGIAVAIVAIAYAGTLIIESRIKDLLGKDGTAQRMHVDLSGVVLENVVLGAPPGWPTDETFRAERVIAIPEWSDLFAQRTHIKRLTVQNFYLSVLRSGNGRIVMLPTLRRNEQDKTHDEGTEDQPNHTTLIDQLIFENGSLDFYDAKASKPPFKISVKPVSAQIGSIDFSHFNTRTQIDLNGTVLGKSHAGKIAVQGWLQADTLDAQIKTTLRNVDVRTLSPYLKRGAQNGVSGGAVDLDMTTQVENRKINARGIVSLRDLKVEDSEGLLSLPRRAMVASLEDSSGKVSFNFTLTGSVSAPRFTIEQGASARIAGGLANLLGIGIEGIAGGIGGAVEGVGDAISGFLPK
jgi:hypothetical protein